MGAAESSTAAASSPPDGPDDDPSSAAAAGGARLVRVPGSLAGGQAELRAAVAALVARLGGRLPGVDGQGGIELEVPHIAQEGTWDCGVSCVQMALGYAMRLAGPYPGEVGREGLLARVGAESIWTVDLLFLLQEYARLTGRAVLFATTGPGVCMQYSQVAYYARQFERDVARVLGRFKEANGAGLDIYEGSLPWQTLRDLLLTGRVLLLLLVDSRLLPRPPPPPATGTGTGTEGPQSSTTTQEAQQQQPPLPPSSSSLSSSSAAAAAPPLATGAYCGHYILLTGYRAHPPAFFYKDPARPTAGGIGDHLIGPAALDAARTSYGTDEDILVIEVPPPPSSS